ncbi:MAG: hypothetical protein HOP30_13755 [Cyclobacteriaceae bacterium]|nr:hypothetical protein [Cyclobacteriaceae bacterium]
MKIINRLIRLEFKPNNYLFYLDSAAIKEWHYKYHEYHHKVKLEYDSVDNFNNRDYLPYGILALYVGYNSLKINDLLRGKNEPCYSSVKDSLINQISVLDQELKKIKVEQNLVVIRRIPNLAFEQMIDNSREFLCDKGFLSTSLDLSYRKDNESVSAPVNNETLLIIKVPKGQTALYLEPISKREEYELLFPRNLKLIIEKRYLIINNNILITSVFDR